MKIKLSKAQSRLIRRLRAGERLHHMQGLNASCFFSANQKSVSWATIHTLEKLQIVVRSDKFIELTELGLTVQLNQEAE